MLLRYLSQNICFTHPCNQPYQELTMDECLTMWKLSMFLENVLRFLPKPYPLLGMLPSLLFLTPTTACPNTTQTSRLTSMQSLWWTFLGYAPSSSARRNLLILWILTTLHLNPHLRSSSIFYLVSEFDAYNYYTHCTDERVKAQKINLLEKTQEGGKI